MGVVGKTLAPENSTKVFLHIRSLHRHLGRQYLGAGLLIHNVLHMGGFHPLPSTAEVDADGVDGLTFHYRWFGADYVVAIIGFLDKFWGVILEPTFSNE